MVRPHLGPKQQIRQEELSERVPDPLRVSAVPQHLAKHLPIPEVLRQLPKEQGSRIPAQTLTSRLDPDAAVEIRLEKRTLTITHGVSCGGTGEGSNLLRPNNMRHGLFVSLYLTVSGLVNKAG